MSVLIKGMKMPEGCITCMFKSDSMFNRTMWCEWLDDPLGDYTKCDEEWRHPDCPLVEVSTPHGPLIDADEIIEVQMFDEMYDEWTLRTMSVAEYLASAADIPPTIIEAEEGDPDVSAD